LIGAHAMPRITISYRRDDSLDITGRIFDRLAGHFGREAVFRDIDSIPPGADFRRHIERVLDDSDIILAIVGPRWIGPDNEQLRLASPADPVRLEIETALRKYKPLIPVLVARAVMPHPDVLPDSLRDFVYRNAVQVDSGQDFDVHVGRLIRAIERLLRIDEERPAHEAVQGVTPTIEPAPSIEPTPKAEPPVDPVAPPIDRPVVRANRGHTGRWAIGLGLVVILGIIGASGWWVLVEQPAERDALKNGKAALGISSGLVGPKPVPQQSSAPLTIEATERTILNDEWLQCDRLVEQYKRNPTTDGNIIMSAGIELVTSPYDQKVLSALHFFVGHLWMHLLTDQDAAKLIEAVIPLTRNSNPEIRKNVASLFDVGAPNGTIAEMAYGFLKQLARDQNDAVREAALRSIGALVLQVPQHVKDDMWEGLLNEWTNETKEKVRSAALASLKGFDLSDENRKLTLSKIIADALNSYSEDIINSAMWVLGGLDSAFTPSKSLEPVIFARVLNLYQSNRSIPRDWFITTFENLPGKLPSWAEAMLEKDRQERDRQDKERIRMERVLRSKK
jgi:hypothetical protein